MTQPFEPLPNVDHLTALLKTFPPLDYKARIEMLNSVSVVKDHLQVREKSAGFGRVWQMLTGEDVDRTNEMFRELSQSVGYLKQQSDHLEAHKQKMAAGVALLTRECERLHREVERLGAGLPDGASFLQYLTAVEQRLHRAERQHNADLFIRSEARRLRHDAGDSMPLLLRLVMAVESVVWQSGDGFQRQDASLIELAKGELADAVGHGHGIHCKSLVPLNALVRECQGITSISRDGIALLLNNGKQSGSLASLFMAATDELDRSSADMDSLLASAGLRYVMPLDEVVKCLLLESIDRLNPPEVVEEVRTDSEVLSDGARNGVAVTSEPAVPMSPSATTDPRKIGLVLSGGGAKGAYLAGVLRAMAEHGLQPSAVAGTSIGALNGAIVASCRDVSTAAVTLNEVWNEMAECSPIALNNQGLAVMLGDALLRVATTLASPRAAPLIAKLAKAGKMYAKRQGIDMSVLSSDPVTKILRRRLDYGTTKNWLPFWVAAFRGTAGDAIWETIKGYGFNMDNNKSEFFKVQDFEPKDVEALILASAALPVLYPKQVLGDSVFFDGGIGGARRQQGNTPITPLIEHGCERCIVTHLSNGSLWTRSAFPGVEVLEVRPSDDLAPEGAKAMLNFSREKIHLLMEMGFKDASKLFKEARDQMLLCEGS